MAEWGPILVIGLAMICISVSSVFSAIDKYRTNRQPQPVVKKQATRSKPKGQDIESDPPKGLGIRVDNDWSGPEI